MIKLVCGAIIFLVSLHAATAQVIKVGIVGPFSGPLAEAGANFKAGIEAYQHANGTSVGGKTVEFIYRDLGAPDPARARAIVQELIVKERVSYLGGFFFTPNVLAVSSLLSQAKIPLVVFNAAGSSITKSSPMIVRTSFTMSQDTIPLGNVAYDEGFRKAVTVVSDYAPGIEAEEAFRWSFEANGGSVVDKVRMPLSTVDYAPFMQRLRSAGADCVFLFLPGASPTITFVKSFVENGLDKLNLHLMTTGGFDEPDLSALEAIGDGALGLQITYHYSTFHKSDVNEAFLAAVRKAITPSANVTFYSVQAYDGVHLIYRMISSAGSSEDAVKAIDGIKGFAWQSPRGPVSIDPETRHIRQTVYLGIVEKQNGHFVLNELRSFKNQSDSSMTAPK